MVLGTQCCLGFCNFTELYLREMFRIMGLREDVISVYKNLKGGCQEAGVKLFSVVPGQKAAGTSWKAGIQKVLSFFFFFFEFAAKEFVILFSLVLFCV